MPETTARLQARYALILRRWAMARIPTGALDAATVDELVQGVLLKGFEQADGFESRREGASLTSLRHALFDRIHEQFASRPQPGQLEQAVGSELLRAYEAALRSLAPDQQVGIILRLEMCFPYPEIAEALGNSSQDETRMLVGDAILRLSELLDAR